MNDLKKFVRFFWWISFPARNLRWTSLSNKPPLRLNPTKLFDLVNYYLKSHLHPLPNFQNEVLSCNNLNRLQVPALTENYLILISISRLTLDVCVPPHFISRFSIYKTQAPLLGILISFVNNFWLNFESKQL